MKNFPNITILIVTLNNQRTIKECIRNILLQDYPKKNIEYLNIDGGSEDSTKAILKSSGFKVVDSPIKKNAEAQRAIGIKRAKNNLIVSLDADNYLPNKEWLRQMVKPFMDDPKVIHASTLHYKYRKTDSLYNRYCALFGVVDPIVYYIGRPDRLPQNFSHWNKDKIKKETDGYYIIEFKKDSLPTVGCNGVVYRRDILLKYSRSNPSDFFHIDVFMDLLENGYDRYAIVKNDVIHDTAVSLKSLLKKRVHFLTNYYLDANINNEKRRYFIYNPKRIKDNVRLFIFILYTITMIKPFIDSIRGYIYLRDLAWFVNPFVCWMYFLAYSYVTVKQLLKK